MRLARLLKLDTLPPFFCYELLIPYSAKCWQGKTLANLSFQSFGEENVGKFTIANISYLVIIGE